MLGTGITSHSKTGSKKFTHLNLNKRTEILIELANSKWLPDFCNKVGGHVAPDLQQHLLLICCEMDADRLIQLHQSNGLVYYLVRVGCNAVNGNRYTKFYRDFIRSMDPLPDEYDEEAEDYDETHLRKKQEAVQSVNFKEVANHLNRSEWYVVKLWQLWEDKQSMALMARETKINYREISQIINAIKSQIKEKYNEYDD